MKAWTLLFIAGLLEIGWVIGMKYSQGFTKLGASAATVVLMVLSMFLLSQAIRVIPIGTAYAVWTGIGAAGSALLGIILFQEPAGALRVLCIFLILAGITGLKLF